MTLDQAHGKAGRLSAAYGSGWFFIIPDYVDGGYIVADEYEMNTYHNGAEPVVIYAGGHEVDRNEL